ncbi:hypothetical protein FOZ63_001999 [Perkinsus olseni]|uniref:Uncharacterized protein n=1 Tax=Perkinsus olseni TaxID=32597 RepID=A0A7J6UDM9_PEROL|nr:hypothetical protein FOZ63_001999 [Perkinsus olseni]
MTTADLQLQLKKLEEENKEHIEEKRYEYDFRSNLENDVEDLKRSISLKDKEIADLKRIIGEQNQSTGKQSDASGEEAFHSDGTADEHSQEDDESEYYGTYSESSNEAHGNPSKKVLANKSRDKIGSSTEDKNNGLSAKNISLRSTRTRKLQLVYERYSSRTSRHLIKVISSFGEPMNFVAYIDRVAFAKGEVGPNASAGIGLSDRRLRENPRAQYIRVEAHNQEEGKRGVYVSMQVPRLQVNNTVHK